ncbi:outer membrane beta-barrel protein [Dongia sp.]|uniref:outer membrane beta-barrel protein n=1 Tax=Dongia sp. TaxID=1977262 RepID=UPI0035ADA598
MGASCGNQRRSSFRRPLVLSASILLSYWLCDDSAAQEWTLDTGISQQFLYTDNLLLSRDDEIETFGSITTPGFRLERQSPTLDVWLDGRFDFTEYFSHSEFDSQDQRLRLNVEKDVSERSTLNLNSSFVRDTTIRSEQDTDRFVDQKIGITYWEVRPNWTYLLTPVDRMRLGGSYSSVAYDSSEKTDYEYYGGTLDYGHQLSEIDAVTANLSYFRFVPDETGDAKTDTAAALLGYTYTPSDRLTIGGAAGVGYSIEHGSGDEDDDSDDGGVGYRLKFNAKYQISDSTSGRLTLSHDSEPSSDGEQKTRNRATLGVSHKITPLTTFALNIDYVDTFDYAGLEGSRTDDDESRYTSIRPSLAWAITEDVSLVAEYRYRYKLYDESNDSAMSNSVFLTLRYELPTWGFDGY